jgi:uncharacterized repeat protein (TIGR01451 family)
MHAYRERHTWRKTFYLSAATVLALLLLATLAIPALADTLTVNSSSDSGPGSLRQALADANDGDTIRFDDDYSITLASPLVVDKDVTIDGGDHSIVISGNDAVRVFHVFTDTTVALDSLTIADGKTTTQEVDVVIPYAPPLKFPVGGGVRIEGGATVTMTDCTVRDSTTAYWYNDGMTIYLGYGGGIFNEGALSVVRSTFTDNLAGHATLNGIAGGGAIYNRGTLTVADSAFSGNQANYGAGIHSADGTLVVDNSAISNGSSPFGGGTAIWNENGAATVSDSTISANSVPAMLSGGHGAWAGGLHNDGGTMTVERSIISSNTNGDGNGGGLSNYEGTLEVVDSAILGNTATYYDSDEKEYYGQGGGIYNWSNSVDVLAVMTVTNCSIINNTAGGDGGGIRSGYGSAGSDASLTLINSLVADNLAQRGGGILNGEAGLSEAGLTMINGTVVSNTASTSGGGLYNIDATPTLDNVILWANSAPTGPEIHNTTALSPTISASDIQGSGGSSAWVSALGTDGGGNIDADPAFKDAANDNYRLWIGSPAIDKGENSAVPAGITTDLDGNPRIFNAIVDMGAYEGQPTLSLLKSVAPTTDLAAGAIITYTLRVTNTGVITDANLEVTDTLPTGVDFGGWVTEPGGVVCSGNAFTWTDSIDPEETLLAVFTATLTEDVGGTISNTAHFSGSTMTGESTAAFATGNKVYLPLVMR